MACDVLQTLLGLRRGVRSGQLPRRRIGRALARHEHQTLEPHARRVRPDGLGKIGGVNGTMGHGDIIDKANNAERKADRRGAVC